MHAFLWSGAAERYVDLNPSGCYVSEAYGILGSQQVGIGAGSFTGDHGHALLWTGTAESVVDLHPNGFVRTLAYGTSGSQQVGYGWLASTGISHALLWYGTADSCVDLHPNGFLWSEAHGVSGGQQVGWGRSDIDKNWHALLWYGTAASCVDLNPSGLTGGSVAYGTDGTHQVGSAGGHAVIWSGTAENYIDLHPSSGFSGTGATAIAGGWQVGAGKGPATDYDYHALVWSGTPESVVDLHSYLPDGYDYSWAWGVSANGSVVGEAEVQGVTAVLWVPLIYVEIDIKPGSYPNSINLGNEGVIPVAILSSSEFDATTVDPATVELAGAGVELRGKSNKAMAHKEDVNKDGLIDLVVQITTQNLDPGAFQDGFATLTGRTYAGLFIEGADEITIVPK